MNMKKVNYYIMALLIAGVFGCQRTNEPIPNVTPVAPTVSTANYSNAAGSSATVGGTISTDGGSILLEAGVCYGTTANPTVSGQKVVVATLGGPFTTSLSGLISETQYHYRAYAQNAQGISYGEDKTFTIPFSWPAGRVNYYSLDGNAKEDVTNTNGTMSNATWVTGVKGQAFQGNGTNSLLTFASVNGFETSTKFSVTFWINSATPSPGMAFSLNADNYSWEWTKFFFNIEGSSTASTLDGKLNANDGWGVMVGSNGLKSTVSDIFDGNWHQIALVYDGTKLYAYVDAVLSQTVTIAYTLPLGTFDSFTIGGPGPNAQAQNGWMTNVACKIDQVGLYNTVLSAGDVTSLYNHKY